MYKVWSMKYWYEVLVWSTGMMYEVRTTNLEVIPTRSQNSKQKVEWENWTLSLKCDFFVSSTRFGPSWNYCWSEQYTLFDRAESWLKLSTGDLLLRGTAKREADLSCWYMYVRASQNIALYLENTWCLYLHIACGGWDLCKVQHFKLPTLAFPHISAVDR